MGCLRGRVPTRTAAAAPAVATGCPLAGERRIPVPGAGTAADARLRRRGVVMVVTRADRVGGAQVHVLHLAQGLRRRGIPVRVITGPPGPFTGALHRAGIPSHPVPHLVRPVRPLDDLRALLAIRSLLRHHRPALVAAHSTKATWLARLAAATLGIPCIVTVHGWPWDATAGQGGILRRLSVRLALEGERILGRLAAAVITVSRHDREEGLRRHLFDPRRAVVIPNGVPRPGARPGLRPGRRRGREARFPLRAGSSGSGDPSCGQLPACAEGLLCGELSAGAQGPPCGEPPAGAEGPCGPPLRVVMVARFEAPKDHTTLLRAVALLEGRSRAERGARRVPAAGHGPCCPSAPSRGAEPWASSLAATSWVVELVGDGPGLGPAMDLARQLGIGHRVRFLGVRGDGAAAVVGAAVAVLCSHREGLPLAVLEAMAAGVPVVATAVGGVPEAVRHGVTGLLVPPDDPAAVAGALARLLTDPVLRRRMGVAGSRRHRARFTVHRMVRATLAVYRSVVANDLRQSMLRQRQENPSIVPGAIMGTWARQIRRGGSTSAGPLEETSMQRDQAGDGRSGRPIGG